MKKSYKTGLVSPCMNIFFLSYLYIIFWYLCWNPVLFLYHHFLFYFIIFCFYGFLFVEFPTGYPPPLKNMLNFNGSNLDNIQISQASSSSTATGSGPGSLSQKKTCPYCHQQLSWHALSRHIRDMHKAKSNFVTCKFCQKMFRNKNSLGCHMWRFHKEAKEKDINNKDHMDGTNILKALDKDDHVKDSSATSTME